MTFPYAILEINMHSDQIKQLLYNAEHKGYYMSCGISIFQTPDNS